MKKTSKIGVKSRRMKAGWITITSLKYESLIVYPVLQDVFLFCFY